MWCSEEALCDYFPSLFALAANKEELVLPTRRSWWLICGTLLGRKEGGFLALLDLSMVERPRSLVDFLTWLGFR